MAESSQPTGETLLQRLLALTPEQRALEVVVQDRNGVGYAIKDRITVARCDGEGVVVEDDGAAEEDYDGGPVLLIEID